MSFKGVYSDGQGRKRPVTERNGLSSPRRYRFPDSNKPIKLENLGPLDELGYLRKEPVEKRQASLDKAV